MSRIKIKDLNVSLEELKKRDPLILKKIMGGTGYLAYALTFGARGGALGAVCLPATPIFGSNNPSGPFSQSLSNLEDNG